VTSRLCQITIVKHELYLPPASTCFTIRLHIENTIHAVLDESTPPLSGTRNPPCPERLKVKTPVSDISYKKIATYWLVHLCAAKYYKDLATGLCQLFCGTKLTGINPISECDSIQAQPKRCSFTLGRVGELNFAWILERLTLI